MAQYRVNGDKPVGELLRLVSQGVISEDEWRSVVDGWKSQGFYRVTLDHLTLRHYGRVLACKIDPDAVLVHVNATGIKEYATAGDIPTALYLDTLTGLKSDLNRIESAFKNLPKASLTAEELEAGFGNIDFGLFGIVDTLACRQGLTDEQVKDMPLSDVIGKLSIIGARAQAERRLSDIRARKSRH